MENEFANQPRQRLFAGTRVRRLRKRLGHNQLQMARRLGISLSYLSQIESDDRPITGAVLIALAREFPSDWAELESGGEADLLAHAAAAFADPTIAEEEISAHALEAAVKRQPALARRLVAVHAAYRRAQEQTRSLNEALDHGSDLGSPLPWDEIRDWFHDQENYIDAIDRAAERLATELLHGSDATLEGLLWQRHAVTILRNGRDRVLRTYDEDGRKLTIDGTLPFQSQRFLMAHQLMRLELAPLIDRHVEEAQVRSDASRRLLSVGLSNYSAGAFLMPYKAFRAAAREQRHDVDALALAFGVSFEQVCHRLSTLQRPGLAGVPMFFCRVDLAGNITKRHSATRLQFARFGGACPLWIVHEAAAIPERLWTQLAEMPDGVRYVSMAKGLVKGSGSFARASRRYAVVLGCEASHARDFIYADGLDLQGAGSATPIGISCRICPRESCEQRAFPPIGRNISVDPNHRQAVPYALD